MTDLICPYGKHCKARDECIHSDGHTKRLACVDICAPIDGDEPQVGCVPVEQESEVEQ